MATEKKRTVVTPIFRVSYCFAFSPQKMMKGKPIPEEKQKHSVTAIFDPKKFTDADKERWKDVQALADETAMAAFGKTIAKLPKNYKTPFHDAEEKENTPGFEPGMIYINLTTKFKPEIVGPDGETPITSPDEFFSGCYARASINAYSFNIESNGVALGLSSLKKIKTGPRLDGKASAKAAFKDLGAEGEDEDDDLT